MDLATHETSREHLVRVPLGSLTLEGNLGIPEGAVGAVLFAHGSGSGRHSPRNRFVAGQLRAAGLATLLVDLLTEEEEAVDQHTAHLRFDIGLLANRLVGATDWLAANPATAGLAVGYFGASTGGGAALVAAALRPNRVAAVVSRGGRPDLAGDALVAVQAPTLLIVGGNDVPVIGMNQTALARLAAPEKKLVIVPGASHLFEEPGKLDEVARLAADWFTRYLRAGPGQYSLAGMIGGPHHGATTTLVPRRSELKALHGEIQMLFQNRTEAGHVLASKLRKYAYRSDVVVLALPRGGVPVAFEVARELHAPLDVFVVRKLGLPGNEEYAIGAIATGGVRVLNEEMVKSLAIPQHVIDAITAEEIEELQRRERAYRGDRPAPLLRGRTVILIDDGLATGSTMRAAVTALRQQKPARIVVAVPVGAPDTCAEFQDEADEAICARTPDPFCAVGLWYRDFSQTTDEEVHDLLERADEECAPA